MPYSFLTIVGRVPPALHLRSYNILFTCVSYRRIIHEKTEMSWWCKGGTLSRHVRGLGFDSRVRTLFSIDHCCIYLVFTMLFISVKRMYSLTWCSVHGLVPYSFLTLIGRAPPALHLRSYNIVHLCVLIVG